MDHLPGAPRALTVVAMQANFRVGAVSANVDKIISAMRRNADADLLVTTECSVTGYPVEDLVHSHEFLGAVHEGLMRIRDAAESGEGCPVIVGAPVRIDGELRNSAFFFAPRRAERIDKHQLPNYGPFDEKRYFSTGSLPNPIQFKGLSLGVLICEDIWFPAGAYNLAHAGADVIISINGSPFVKGKNDVRRSVVENRRLSTALPILYVNQLGGQDELVFDGNSFAMDADGTIAGRLKAFEEDEARFVVAVEGHNRTIRAEEAEVAERKALPGEEETYGALLLGLRDYVEKNGFKGVMLGVSGGIDSALAATISVDALGPDRVWGVMMPYRWTSELSMSEARELAANLGIRCDVAPIIDAVEAHAAAITKATGIVPSGVALENMQARMRGLTLMTLSNQVGHLREGFMVVSTGNKSEVSVGYATLYGDMCGGYNVLKDVYKTEVYALARWRNGRRPEGGLGPSGICIPPGTIERPPSAELAPGQKDEDSLPAYPVLDGILRLMVDGSKDIEEIVSAGYDRAVVCNVRRLLDRAEYKRRQGAPGPKVTDMIFGRDRRVPITNGFSQQIC